VEPATVGQWGTVEWATSASGKLPALEFFESLSSQDAAKIMALFESMAESGAIKNQEKFKKLGNFGSWAVWEFKSFQLRFLGGFLPGNRFLVAVGLRKKRQKHQRRDIERTAKILEEHMQLANFTAPGEKHR